MREQVGPSVRIEATERGLGERVVEVEGGDARRRRRREVRPHEERAANDAPAGRHLDAAQGGAHVALALAPQCSARLRLVLAVAELYDVHRRPTARAGFPSQSSRCGQPRVMGRMVVLLPMVPVLTVAANSVHAERLTGRADEGRERAREALEHAASLVCVCRVAALWCKFPTVPNSDTDAVAQLKLKNTQQLHIQPLFVLDAGPPCKQSFHSSNPMDTR